MINRNVSMADVAQILKYMYPEAKLMYSDDNSGKLVFRIRMPFETRENVEDDFKYLKNKVAEIKKIIIKGVDNIEQVYMSEPSKDCVLKGKECKGFSKPGEVYEVQEEYHMTTDGANLFDLLCRDDVDASRTYSIDPNEMNSIFGIEAAKLIVEQQFRHIMTSAGAMTSPRHVSLLVDKMAHTGEFMSVDRHGISKEDIGPLAKCSFERTPDELREAALFGDIDRLKGVSANIMVGQIPECGTGTIKIFLDEDMLAEELAKRGVSATELDDELDEKAVFKEFQQKMCINDDDQIKINLKTHHGDGLSLSQIPDVVVD
jgi:DNA-directed RNA polymerase II subunit RPB1